MIKLYYHPTPNPAKVALFLEEAGLPYEIVPVDTRKGEQLTPAYLALNPNGRTPTLVDGDVTVFDSSAILLYLAEKTGKFLPENTPAQRADLYSWMMFIASGIGPYSGQCVHFKYFAADSTYAVKRYQFEAERHWGIIDARLGKHRFMLGDTYTIVDMSLWGWARAVSRVLGEESAKKLTNLKRWFDAMNTRPATKRVEDLKNQHVFKEEIDDAARHFMFQHLKA